MIDFYYKVCQVLQSVTVIAKWEVTKELYLVKSHLEVKILQLLYTETRYIYDSHIGRYQPKVICRNLVYEIQTNHIFLVTLIFV